MQVGFSPINFQQRQNKTQNTNFEHKIPVNSSINKPSTFIEMIERGAHEDSAENRGLLKQVVSGIKKRFGKSGKWDIQDIKESVLENSNWKKDDELKDIFKGY